MVNVFVAIFCGNSKFINRNWSDKVAHGRLWANGGGNVELYNSDYNFWTPNGLSAADPATGSLPVKDTDSFIKFSQIFPAPGRSDPNGPIVSQGSGGWCWTSSPGGSTNGYYVNFNGGGVYPTNNNNSAMAMTIRCVRI
jgi:hypothetical protein